MSEEKSQVWLEKADRTVERLSYYQQLEQYFNESPKTVLDKLIDFPKYVPNNTVARFIARYEVFKLCLNVHGCVIECGVLGGVGVMTFAQISSILEPYNLTRKIIGFDTFSGFPHISDKDAKGNAWNFDGLTDHDIRRAVVEKSSEAAAEKIDALPEAEREAYVLHRFDAAIEMAPAKPEAPKGNRGLDRVRAQGAYRADAGDGDGKSRLQQSRERADAVQRDRGLRPLGTPVPKLASQIKTD